MHEFLGLCFTCGKRSIHACFGTCLMSLSAYVHLNKFKLVWSTLFWNKKKDGLTKIEKVHEICFAHFLVVFSSPIGY